MPEHTTEIIIPKRTEEVQDIIERMPNKFGKYITLLVLFIISLILIFGYLVRYPDIVTGQLTVNADQAPLKLVAEGSGKLRINNIKSQDTVYAGQVLAWIDNATTPDEIAWLRNTFNEIKLPTSNAATLYSQLPHDKPLGDITSIYSSFLTSLKELADYQTNKLFDKQIAAMKKMLNEQGNALATLSEKERISRANLVLADRFYTRDSTLYSEKTMSAAEFDRATGNHLNSEDQYQNSLRELSSTRERIGNTESSIQELLIQKNETEHRLALNLLSIHNTIIDQLNIWEQRYLFLAPFDGQVQFLKFWNENQFVQNGEPVFTVVPHQNKILGQVFLPANGAGKVKVGQEVVVKLTDYPYMEYGSVKGIVSSISLTTNIVSTEKGNVETYLVSVAFPEQLKTNYGSQLDFKYEIKGTADIITKDRRLIERFFDNMKYVLQDK